VSLVRFIAARLGLKHEAAEVAQEAYVKVLSLEEGEAGLDGGSRADERSLTSPRSAKSPALITVTGARPMRSMLRCA